MSVLESSVEFDSRLGARVILVVMREGDDQTKVSSNPSLKNKKGLCDLWYFILNTRNICSLFNKDIKRMNNKIETHYVNLLIIMCNSIGQ